ncbi:MAG: rod-binding protein [Pirellulaceae bacterium]|nr:rod-binding protein [Pirellulaceae bacterium]
MINPTQSGLQIDQFDTTNVQKNLKNGKAFTLGAQETTQEISSKNGGSPELKKAFSDFVGNTIFSQLMKSMRSTTKGAAYMNGGRAEEMFQKQLDQIMVEEMSDATADDIAQPMYELFQNQRNTKPQFQAVA